MFLVNYLDLSFDNFIYMLIDISSSLTYFLDSFFIKNLLLIVYFDLIGDVSELFTILILVSILINTVFILLIYVHQLTSTTLLNSNTNFKNNTIKIFKYTYYTNLIKNFKFNIVL